jgi:glycosyltransferase involved in cell wall biosynthesis
MNILAHIKGMDGCSYHRIFLPHKKARFVSSLSEEDLKWCDILIYSRHIYEHPDFLDQMRKKYGFKIIVDTDDWWETDKDHPKHAWWTNSNMGLQIRQHLINADAVTCTGEYLASLVPNKHVYVIPNMLPYGDSQFAYREYKTGDRVRLVYASTIMNYKNTELIAGAMHKLADLNIELAILGYQENPLFDQVINNLTANRKIPFDLVPWADSSSYMLNYGGDIGIIPSKDSKFNKCKSNLKVLEFASQKMPVVVSKVDPYNWMPVCYASNENQWVDQITKLVNDAEMRLNLGKKIYRFCKVNYNLNNEQRFNSYVQILQRSNSHSR